MTEQAPTAEPATSIRQTAKIWRQRKAERRSANGTAPASDPHVRADCVSVMYRATPAVAANLVCGAFFVVAAYPYVSTLTLAVWLAVLLVSLLARLILKRTYLARPLPVADADRWGRYFAVGSCTSGLVWSFAVVLAFQPNSELIHALTMVILAGLIAGSATSASAYRLSYFCFMLPPITVLTVMLLAAQQREQYIMAGLTVLFAVFVSIIAVRLSRALEQSFALRHANAELVDDLRDALDKVKQSNRAKSDFLANMSHELRTPLNAIIGFSGMIMSEALGPIGSPRYKEYARDIQESGNHLVGLISNILDVSKIEAGQVELRTAEIDIHDVIQSCLTIIRDRARAERVAIAVDVAPDLPVLVADRTKIKQVLINLLTNAVKFTPAGGSVTISVNSAPNNGYRIEIADTGVGMATEDIPRALAAFHQVKNKPQGVDEGTGLGLTLAKSLVELHGGRLELASTVGVGTTVTVIFPPAARTSQHALGGAPEHATHHPPRHAMSA